MVDEILIFLIGKYLVSGSDDKTIKLWRTSDYFNFKTLTGHTDAIKEVVFSPNSFKINLIYK